MAKTRRDIFSGQLMTWYEEGWQPARSRLGVLGSYAMDTGYLKKNALEDHLARYAETHSPELLVDIPTWDGVDRVQQIASCVKLKNCTQDHFKELLLEWGAKMFQRVSNPRVQNKIIVLKGGQNIGKDTLVNALLDGLGCLKANLTISRNETDNFAMLADHMVLNINEFDRAAKVEAGTLKAWITQEEATFRRPYEKSHRRYDLRTSFIATCNVDEILRDPTGNRRFIIFDIESIDWNYPTDQSLQILAQFKQLALDGFEASKGAVEAMKAYIHGQTPDDPKDIVLVDFDDRLKLFEENHPGEKVFSFSKVKEMIFDLARSHNMKNQELLTLLKRSGRGSRTNSGPVYYRPRTAPGQTA